jgi:hypothetical protein
VPDKSASCRSIRPVRVSLPSIWSAAFGTGTAVSPTTTLCGSMPSVRVPQRHLITAMRSGLVEWQEVLSNTVLGRLQTTIGALIVCHSLGPPRSAPTWQADLSGTGQPEIVGMLTAPGIAGNRADTVCWALG